MNEVSQEFFPSHETENSARARRKEQIGAKRRPAAATGQPVREGADLLCDTWRLSNKQRMLCGFIGTAFLVPYTALSLTYPEWTGHIGQRLSLALFSFLGQSALVMPFLLVYLVMSCAGLRPLRKTRYAYCVPLVVALALLFQLSSQTGGWLGRLLSGLLTTAVGTGGAWLLTCTLTILLTLAFFPKAWEESVQALGMAQEHLREAWLRWQDGRQKRAEIRAARQGEIAQEQRPAAQRVSGAPEYPLRDDAYGNGPSANPIAGGHEPRWSEDSPGGSWEEDGCHEDSLPRDPRPVVIEDSWEPEAEEDPHESLEIPAPPAPPRLRESQEAASVTRPLPEAHHPTPPAALAEEPGERPRQEAPVTKLLPGRTASAPGLSLPAPSSVPSPVPTPDDPRAAIPRARPFELPPLALLDDVPVSARRPRSEDKSQALLDALDAFGVKAKLLQIVRGPTVTRYELLPARGVKVSKFTSLTNDIALALASTAVRIEAPIPGKSAIGIEIPNDVTDLVVIKDILRDSIFTESKGLTVALGKDLSGRPVVTDLQKMPHLLVAGTTGSGKSVCVNGLILSLLYRFTPDQLQLMMVDPKQVELSVYEDIPHLVGFSEGGKGEIIVDPKKAAQALYQVVELMEQRYTLFAERRVRNLAEYNEKSDAPLPWFVVIIDELADLMMVASKSVETSICRIAQKARAAGIHLVLATQRPSADVITGLIKVNIPSRAAFAVSSQVDSRVILDSGGAEHLLGKGDMLFLPVDASDPKRLQGAYVNNDEISRVVEFWKGQHLPENRIEFELKDDPLALEEEESDEDSDDALLEEALRAILARDQASASMLQTDLKVGYARARRLLMAMEKKGWVSPAEGSKPRKILFSGALPENASAS